MRTNRWLIVWMTLGLLALGCGNECDPCDCDDDDDDNGADDDDVADECDEDSECSAWEICEEHLCIDGDRNNAFDEAVLVSDGSELTGYINPAGDVDYFRMQGERGSFFRAYAFTEDGSDEEGLDTVLSFYDDDESEQGYNDTFERLSNLYGTDAVYIGCTATDDTYYLTLEDYGTFVNDPGSYAGGSDYTYTLMVSAMEDSATETEPNDTLGDADDSGIEDYNISYDRAGVIGDDGDVDLWAVTVDPGSRLRIYGYEHTASDLSSRYRVLDGDGEVMATYEGLGWELDAGVPVLNETVYIEVGDAGGSGSDEHCYVMHLAADPMGEMYYAEAEPNDEFGQELLQQNDSDTLAVAGAVSPAGDVDRFTFIATGGEEIDVTLHARTYGSELAAHVRVLDPALTELASVDVPGAEDAVIEGLELTDPGSYHFEVTAADPADGGADHWYALYVEVL